MVMCSVYNMQAEVVLRSTYYIFDFLIMHSNIWSDLNVDTGDAY